ncbi:MAG: TetR/AcrR family transcriptional regulator [Cyclobacteriaceae bacterium]
MVSLSIRLNASLYLKDPQNSALGWKIVTEGTRLIDKLGFENFTFKKLADEINSTEASVYRYFENKHRLLLYLIDWYWTWLEYQFDYSSNNIEDPRKKLEIYIDLLTSDKKADFYSNGIDGQALNRIIMSEFEKTYLTKQVDQDNREGMFLPFKSVCKKIAALVHQINPSFPYPHALVSTLILSVNHQLFYAQHLPSLTEIQFNPKTHHQQLNAFINLLMNKLIQP